MNQQLNAPIHTQFQGYDSGNVPIGGPAPTNIQPQGNMPAQAMGNFNTGGMSEGPMPNAGFNQNFNTPIPNGVPEQQFQQMTQPQQHQIQQPGQPQGYGMTNDFNQTQQVQSQQAQAQAQTQQAQSQQAQQAPVINPMLQTQQPQFSNQEIPIQRRADVQTLQQHNDQSFVPATPNDYKWEVPQGMNIDPQTNTDFRKLSHDTGLTQTQFESMNNFVSTQYEKVNAAQQQHVEALNQKQAETSTALKGEWGEQYESKMAKIGSVLQQEMGEAGVQLMNSPGFKTDASLQKMIGKFSDMVTEHSFNVGGGSSNVNSVRDQANKIMSNAAYFDPASIDHKQVVDQMASLHNPQGTNLDAPIIPQGNPIY